MINFEKKLLTIMFVITAITSCKTTEEVITYKVDYGYFSATGEEKDVAVIVLGGDEGGIPNYDYNSLILNGYPVLALGYIGTENTPSTLEEIPLEYFDDAIKIFKSMDNVKDKKIVVIGHSTGGGLALLLASLNPEIQGVICKVPSSVVFAGSGVKNTSSWSLGGNPIAYVPYAPYDFSTISNHEYVDFYIKTLEQDIPMDEATIKVENINGPILLFSGTEDTVWPSTDMCNSIVQRLDDNNYAFEYDHIAYEGAGHTLTEYFVMGGSVEANKNARIDSTAKILEFLENLGNK